MAPASSYSAVLASRAAGQARLDHDGLEPSPARIPRGFVAGDFEISGHVGLQSRPPVEGQAEVMTQGRQRRLRRYAVAWSRRRTASSILVPKRRSAASWSRTTFARRITRDHDGRCGQGLVEARASCVLSLALGAGQSGGGGQERRRLDDRRPRRSLIVTDVSARGTIDPEPVQQCELHGTTP